MVVLVVGGESNKHVYHTPGKRRGKRRGIEKKMALLCFCVDKIKRKQPKLSWIIWVGSKVKNDGSLLNRFSHRRASKGRKICRPQGVGFLIWRFGLSGSS